MRHALNANPLNSVYFNSLDGVGGAAGIVAATRRYSWGNVLAVPANGSQHQTLKHFHRLVLTGPAQTAAPLPLPGPKPGQAGGLTAG